MTQIVIAQGKLKHSCPLTFLKACRLSQTYLALKMVSRAGIILKYYRKRKWSLERLVTYPRPLWWWQSRVLGHAVKAKRQRDLEFMFHYSFPFPNSVTFDKFLKNIWGSFPHLPWLCWRTALWTEWTIDCGSVWHSKCLCVCYSI